MPPNTERTGPETFLAILGLFGIMAAGCAILSWLSRCTF